MCKICQNLLERETNYHLNDGFKILLFTCIKNQPHLILKKFNLIQKCCLIEGHIDEKSYEKDKNNFCFSKYITKTLEKYGIKTKAEIVIWDFVEGKFELRYIDNVLIFVGFLKDFNEQNKNISSKSTRIFFGKEQKEIDKDFVCHDFDLAKKAFQSCGASRTLEELYQEKYQYLIS